MSYYPPFPDDCGVKPLPCFYCEHGAMWPDGDENGITIFVCDDCEGIVSYEQGMTWCHQCYIGIALAAAGYASTGYYRDKPTQEEFRALEEYEERNGMHNVVQTYFHAWCDAGRPRPNDIMPPVMLVNTLYGKHGNSRKNK